MRHALLLSIVCISAPGCANRSHPAATAAATDQASERWPTAEEAAAWTVSMNDALRIARDAFEDQNPRHMIYRVDPVVLAEKHFWKVTGASTIAGGWEADIDARTGTVLSSRRLPGR
ncbi:MAG TPA: PepSY domain-containing protein [Phycisphaerales bacterium]|nr:PepSY domain-containing protein [Phycisphaerales bacterium]